MATKVVLNSKDYVVRGQVKRYMVQQLAPVQRASATVREGANIALSSVAWGILTGGLGIARIRKQADFERLATSQWETRWPGQVTPALLPTDTTDDLLTTAATVAVEFNGFLWVLTTALTGGTVVQVYYFTGATGRWTANTIRTLGTVQAQAVYDLWTDGQRLFAAFKDALTTGTQVYTSTDGSSWSGAVPTGITTAYEDSALFWKSGTTLLLAVGDTSAKSIWVYKSTNNFANVTLAATIVSSSGPKGWATYQNKAGSVVPLLGTAEGVWEIDLTNSAASLMIGMAAHANNCKRMCVWEDALYVPVGGVGGGMYRWQWDGSRMVFVNVGMNRDDGVAAAGDFVSLWPAEGGWLFGMDSAYNVWALDRDFRWHSMVAGANSAYFVAVSSLTDATVRLHYNHGVNLQYLTKPLSNPGSTSGLVYNTSVAIEMPELDVFMPANDKCFLCLAWDGVIDATSQVAVVYDVAGASPATSLGTFTSTVKTLTFGSGAGVSGKTLRLKLTHTNSTTTHKATLNTLILEYQVVLPDLEGYVFAVDLWESATLRQGGAEEVIADLTTVLPGAMVTLAPFQYGKMAETKVRVRALEGLEDAVSAPDALDEGERRGIVTVTCEEVL